MRCRGCRGGVSRGMFVSGRGVDGGKEGESRCTGTACAAILKDSR